MRPPSLALGTRRQHVALLVVLMAPLVSACGGGAGSAAGDAKWTETAAPPALAAVTPNPFEPSGAAPTTIVAEPMVAEPMEAPAAAIDPSSEPAASLPETDENGIPYCD